MKAFLAAAAPDHGSSLLARELVHKSAPSGVLLTGLAHAHGDVFDAAAHWPRSHPTFDRGGDGRHHPLMVAETLRQLGLAIPLRFYGTGPDSRFLIEELRFALDPAAEPRAAHGGTTVSCRVWLERIRVDGRGRPRAFDLRVRVLDGGVPFAAAWGRARILRGAVYAALRRQRPEGGGVCAPPGTGARATPPEPPVAGAPATPPAPEEVGVPLASDVLVAVTAGGEILLRPHDLLHPFYFDHPCDHVPGMCLLEAARQAVAIRFGIPAVRAVAGVFHMPRFTELEPAAAVACRRTGPSYTVDVVQGGVRTVGAVLWPDD